MVDDVLKEIQKKMVDYETDWEYSEKKDLYMHPTRIFAYGSLSEDLRKHLEEINLEKVFLKDPKPNWIKYAFREWELLLLNSFLTFIKAFVFKPSNSERQEQVWPLVFQLDNGKYIFFAPLKFAGSIANYTGTLAWETTNSTLFERDIREVINE